MALWVFGKINQKAGFYECENCGEKYVPSMTAIIFAPHRGLTKYLKCPNCGKINQNYVGSCGCGEIKPNDNLC